MHIAGLFTYMYQMHGSENVKRSQTTSKFKGVSMVK